MHPLLLSAIPSGERRDSNTFNLPFYFRTGSLCWCLSSTDTRGSDGAA
jgi:hypothetical protein